jgi:hypothetical protein
LKYPAPHLVVGAGRTAQGDPGPEPREQAIDASRRMIWGEFPLAAWRRSGSLGERCAGKLLEAAALTCKLAAEVRYLDIHEDDQLDEAQLAAWLKQASRLPGERM